MPSFQKKFHLSSPSSSPRRQVAASTSSSSSSFFLSFFLLLLLLFFLFYFLSSLPWPSPENHLSHCRLLSHGPLAVSQHRWMWTLSFLATDLLSLPKSSHTCGCSPSLITRHPFVIFGQLRHFWTPCPELFPVVPNLFDKDHQIFVTFLRAPKLFDHFLAKWWPFTVNWPQIGDLCTIFFDLRYNLNMFGDGCRTKFNTMVPSLGALYMARPRGYLGGSELKIANPIHHVTRFNA